MSEKSLQDVRFARAGDVMTKEVLSIEGTATVADAVRMMKERKVSSLFVNRRGQEDAWGIVTRKDVVNKVVDPGKDPAEVKVFEVMSKPHFAMWWIDAGTTPTAAEGWRRLEYLRENGPSDYAFGWESLPAAHLWRKQRCA